MSGVEGRWLRSGCAGFDRPRIAVFKFTANKPTCLFQMFVVMQDIVPMLKIFS